jgi:hypothetical protein
VQTKANFHELLQTLLLRKLDGTFTERNALKGGSELNWVIEGTPILGQKNLSPYHIERPPRVLPVGWGALDGGKGAPAGGERVIL